MKAATDSDRHGKPPEGFKISEGRGPFTTHNGPVYRAVERGDHRSGLIVLDRHCNGMGILHGGMASAFADGALAWGIWGLVGRSGVTLKLNMTFMEAVREGDWLEARPRVTGIVGDIVHASADLVVGSEKLSARADAVFRARPKPARAQA